MRRPYSGDKSITSEYGNRSFYMNGQLVNDFHSGIDIGGVFDVLAAGGGTVIAAFRGGRVDANPNINTPANYIKIDHGNGVQTYYWHLSSVDVSVGQSVSEGQKIGVSGRTGYATGNHLHFSVYVNGGSRNPRDFVDFNTDNSNNSNNNNMNSNEFVTVQSGWGLSHVAQAAGLPNIGSPDTWAYIYSLNQGLRGSWDWQSLNARMGAGDVLRVRPAAAPAEAPVSTVEIDKLKKQIDQLNADKLKIEQDAKANYEALVLKETEKDIAQTAELNKVKEEKRIELEELTTQLEQKKSEYAALEGSSIRIDNSALPAQVSNILVTGFTEELKANGIKEKWHAWIDAHFKSNFMRQLLKYTWPAWFFFLITISLLAAQSYNGSNQLLVTLIPPFLTLGAAVVQFLLTNFDKNKDSKVDFNDFTDIFNEQPENR